MLLPPLAGFALSVGAGLGLLNHSPAFGTVLDGFAINTQDKAVTVTLFTDQRAQYTTENHGKQFTIVLPDTQLSPEQINNGLPVVIDNKNRFIGRAVPTEDGKVKIILPNLPASEYSVSIQQKRPGQAAGSAESSALIKPRAAVSEKDSTFEDIAGTFPKPVATPPGNSLKTGSGGNSVIQLSSAPFEGGAVGTSAGTGQVWNPYVVSVPSPGKSAYSNYKPVVQPKPQPRHVPPPIYDVPLNTVSVAESLGQSPPNFSEALNGGGNNPNPAVKDPLWYLHSLPPADLNRMPIDDLSGLAKESLFMPTVNLIPEANQTVQPERGPFTELKDAILGLPQWLLITVAVFLAGIGLFTLTGGMVLMRLLFAQARQGHIGPAMAQPTFIIPPGFQFGVDANGQPVFEPVAGKSGYVTRPEASHKLAFEDKASVDALDYLKRTPDNVTKAVQNAVLIKFPANRRGARKKGPATRRPGMSAANFSL